MSQAENPLEKIKSDLDSLRRKINDLQKKASFADEVRNVTERVAKLREHEAEAKRLRGRGWSWDPEWETVIADLLKDSAEVTRTLRDETSRATDRLQRSLDALESTVNRLPVATHVRDDIERADRQAESIEEDISSVEERVQSILKPFVEPYDLLERELKETDTHLDRFEAAKFQMQPGEHPWLTVDATWEDSPNGKLNGFLYFSDRRIRFEQKETITTKKWLFFTASSEEKHELLLDEPVGNLLSSDDTTRGMVFKDQLITLKWTNAARYRATTFDVNTGYAKEWDQKIEDLKAGKLTHLLTKQASANPNAGMPVDPPKKCEACGASLDAPVRGQTVLPCRFCGHRHDLVLG